MRIPSQKMLENYGWSPELSRMLRRRMEDCRESVRGICVNPGRKVNECLRDIDSLIGGFGVEYIQHGSNRRSPAIAYVNMGDTYATTIMLINGNFAVGNWGSIVERGNYQ